MRFLILIYLFSFSKLVVSQHHKEDFRIVSEMMDSVKRVKSLRYNLKSLERIETGYAIASTKVKLQVHPRKSYLINPEKKLEILYNEENSLNKCLVKPHVFPYVTMSLDPRGNLMRKNQHFTIYELGFEFLSKTLAVALSKEKENLHKHLKQIGKVEKNKMNCYLMVYENTSFSYTDYIVQHKETVASIATKFNVNDYMLRCKNNLYDNYGYIKNGTKIKIPTHYCKKALFYIDEKTMLPISISIYDDVGLFESYDYSDIELNKNIPEEEFKKGYKDYSF